MPLNQYEHDALTEIDAWYAKQLEPSSNPFRHASKLIGDGVGAVVKIPGLREAMQAFEALLQRGFVAAAETVPVSKVAEEYMDQAVTDIAGIRTISLEFPDAATKNFGYWYASTASAEGAVFSASALLPVIGNAAALALMSADIAAVTGLGMRLVCDYAAHYGYDPRDKREQLFMQGVMALAGTGGHAEKAALLQELGQVSILIAQKATWEELRKHGSVKTIEAAAKALGVKLIKRDLGVLVPVLGAGIGAAANGWFVSQLDDQARYAYRRRFLQEKIDGEIIDVSAEFIPDGEDLPRF